MFEWIERHGADLVVIGSVDYTCVNGARRARSLGKYDDLDRCLDSLAPHLRHGDEVIVVDHEADETRLLRVAARHPRIVAIPRADNPGFAAGVNLAARHAGARFLCLLNPDTIVEGPVLDAMEDWLDTHPTASVVGPRVLNADGSTQPSARRFPGLSTVFGGRSTWMTRRHPNGLD